MRLLKVEHYARNDKEYIMDMHEIVITIDDKDTFIFKDGYCYGREIHNAESFIEAIKYCNPTMEYKEIQIADK